jgi:thioredoxin-like negative regulator of GroEL
MRKILRFTASWCGPCKIMSKQLESVNTNIPIEVIDIDVFPEISAEYGIRSVPTLVMIEDNIEVKRVTGTKSQQELKEWVTYGN